MLPTSIPAITPSWRETHNLDKNKACAFIHLLAWGTGHKYSSGGEGTLKGCWRMTTALRTICALDIPSTTGRPTRYRQTHILEKIDQLRLLILTLTLEYFRLLCLCPD